MIVADGNGFFPPPPLPGGCSPSDDDMHASYLDDTLGSGARRPKCSSQREAHPHATSGAFAHVQ
jgi:hypothetical protein